MPGRSGTTSGARGDVELTRLIAVVPEKGNSGLRYVSGCNHVYLRRGRESSASLAATQRRPDTTPQSHEAFLLVTLPCGTE